MFDISVIIPTYKPKAYIWECLDSMSAQTFPKSQFEVILVLNGCCNPWRNQIEDYLSCKMGDMNVQFIQTDMPGVSNARNMGLDVAQGEYVAFIDDDDYVSPTYLEELYNKSHLDTVALSYSFSFVDGDSSNLSQNRMTNTFERLSKNGRFSFINAKSYFSGPCMKLLHRDIIRGYRFDKRLRNGEDTTFMFAISDKIKFVDFTSRQAIYYRRYRNNSAISSKRSFAERLRANGLQLFIYTKLYLQNIRHYNFYFFITRCGGCIRGVFRS